MALTSASRTIGSHIWVAFAGVALSDTTNKIVNSGDMTAYTVVGPLVKPYSDDTAWVYLGVSEDYERDPGDGTPIEIMAPSPGVLRRTNVLRGESKPKITATILEFGPIAVQLLYRTLALTSASTTWNPQAGKMTTFGWMQIETYDNNDTLVYNAQEYCEIAIKGAVKWDGKSITKVQYEALPIYNSLQTGTN